jgi:hypothetical protein
MYGLIGEDKSDVDTLKILIRRIANNDTVSIKAKGYSSCGEMLKKGARQLHLFKALGCKKFIICYDSDRDCPKKRKQEIVDKVISKVGFKGVFCALVPIQEIESWILADLKAVSKIITSWNPTEEINHPETVKDPKEYLEKLSRQQQRPRYSHATHNPIIARHLDIAKVSMKCSSFRPLIDIVKDSKGNI